MRQVGILAAAGMHVLEDISFLLEDHRRAKNLAQALNAFYVDDVDTNIVFIETEPGKAKKCASLLKDRGILVSAWSENKIRLVLHRDITDENVERTIQAFQELSRTLLFTDSLLWKP
jgi:threonine aldolase